MAPKETDELRQSWIDNAAPWRDAVRERKIESRRVATDAAIVEAVTALQPRTVLDLGCGEGWLARALSEYGIAVTGVDASPELIAAAAELGGGTFLAASYEELADVLGDARFDVAVANFSILDDDLRPLLAAVSRAGALVIQTVHPAFAVGEEPYASGWRTETFRAIEGEWPRPMPWYFRTLSSWVDELGANGWSIASMREPLDAQGFRPLSMILECRR
jgi:SAM-dependent methyltransferase